MVKIWRWNNKTNVQSRQQDFLEKSQRHGGIYIVALGGAVHYWLSPPIYPKAAHDIHAQLYHCIPGQTSQTILANNFFFLRIHIASYCTCLRNTYFEMPLYFLFINFFFFAVLLINSTLFYHLNKGGDYINSSIVANCQLNYLEATPDVFFFFLILIFTLFYSFILPLGTLKLNYTSLNFLQHYKKVCLNIKKFLQGVK